MVALNCSQQYANYFNSAWVSRTGIKYSETHVSFPGLKCWHLFIYLVSLFQSKPIFPSASSRRPTQVSFSPRVDGPSWHSWIYIYTVLYFRFMKCYLLASTLDIVRTVGNPNVLGLPFPAAFTTSYACRGFWKWQSNNIWVTQGWEPLS